MGVKKGQMTAKQRLFCDEYLIDMNATQAAIRAGYSKKTAHAIGLENLEKPLIKEYIQKRLEEKESRLIAKQDEVLQYLTSVMRREKTENIVVTLQTKEEKWVEVGPKKVLKKQSTTKETPAVVPIPAKLTDANKAAELLGKRYALFTEKVERDVDMALNINIDYGEDSGDGG